MKRTIYYATLRTCVENTPPTRTEKNFWHPGPPEQLLFDHLIQHDDAESEPEVEHALMVHQAAMNNTGINWDDFSAKISACTVSPRKRNGEWAVSVVLDWPSETMSLKYEAITVDDGELIQEIKSLLAGADAADLMNVIDLLKA